LPDHGAAISLLINSDSDEKGYIIFTALLEVVLASSFRESSCNYSAIRCSHHFNGFFARISTAKRKRAFARAGKRR
jgi:hypothetical protein